MAKTYGGLSLQLAKIRSALEKVTPPGPDDEFEDLKANTLKHLEPIETYVHGRDTGEGSLNAPEAASE